MLLTLIAIAPLVATARPTSDRDGGATRLAARDGKVVVGSPMPAFAGPSLDGVFSFSRFLARERPSATVVTLFATWCTNSAISGTGFDSRRLHFTSPRHCGLFLCGVPRAPGF
jgi:hypothetical protein